MLKHVLAYGLICFLLIACGPSKSQIATNDAQAIISTQIVGTQAVENYYTQSFFEICKDNEQTEPASRQATGPIWFLELRVFPDVSTDLSIGEIDQSILDGAGRADSHGEAQTLACILRTWVPIETCDYESNDTSSNKTYKIKRYRIDTDVYLVDIASKTTLQKYSFAGGEPRVCPATIPESSFVMLDQQEYDGALASWDEITQTTQDYWTP